MNSLLFPFARRRPLLAILTAFALVYSTAYGAFIGNPALLDPLLGSLVEPLHARGIDVLGGDLSQVPLGTRPRIALLANVPNAQPGDFAEADWMKAFNKGVDGFMFAARVDVIVGGMPKTSKEFIAKWNSVDKSQRVFISFTKRDAAIAGRVKRTLEAQGYVTFTFMNPGGEPKYNPEVVGALFSQAGHYYVLDTRNGRESPGIGHEAQALAAVGAKPRPPSGAGLSPGSGSSGPQSFPPSGGGQAADTWDSAGFVKGIRRGWVVTRNSSGKIFVHESESGGTLNNLLYTARDSGSGKWTVYDSEGRMLGAMKRPSGVNIYECSCE